MALVSGELPPGRSDEVRAHLDDCDACRELVAHTAHALIPTVDERPVRDPALDATEPSAIPAPHERTTRSPGSLGPGALLGRYRITRQLGAGAMGVVYAAEHVDLRRRVALKVVRADPDGDTDEQQLRARLLREARAASAVRHPHVVTVHDVLELDDGSPVMVMDLLDGESLRERLERGPLSVSQATTVAEQLLSALEAAHEVGIIHRDLKPDNVFLAQTKSDGIDARILDFGIAKLTAVDGPAAQTAGLTMTGMLVGTPHYMAPEQAFADPDLDARVDLWATGVIVYEALSGRRPVEGDNLGQLFRKLATMAVEPLAEVAPHLPSPLVEWVHRLLVERDQRLRDASTARRALERATRSHSDEGDTVAPVSLGDSLNPVAPSDSADGLTAPRTEDTLPRSRPWARALVAVAAVASIVGLSSLRHTEPAATLSPSMAHSMADMAPSPGAIGLPTNSPPVVTAEPSAAPPPEPSAPPAVTSEPPARTPSPPRRVTNPAKPASIEAPAPAISALTEPQASEPAGPAASSSGGPGKLLTKPPF